MSFRFQIQTLLTIALLATGGHAVSAQSVNVQGRVFERGSATRLVRATVELIGFGTRFTDRNGIFAFQAVPAGSHTLAVRALGYESRQLTLNLRGDTLLTVELDVAPLQMDSLLAEAKTYTMRGSVDDHMTGRPIIDADVWVGSRRTATNLAGSFKLKGLPASVPGTLRVEAVGYMPVQIEIAAQRDTTVRFRLGMDPIGQRMLAVQIDRLVKRSSATPYSRMQIDRERLATAVSASLADFLRQAGTRKTTQCLFIDDVERPFPPEMLATYLPDEFERIEVIDQGTMVRLYTRRYVAKLQARDRLPPMLLVMGLGRPLCR